MDQNKYTPISDEVYEVLEQDDELRHHYIELLALLHDQLAQVCSRFIETVYQPDEIIPKLEELSDRLRESQTVTIPTFANIALANNLLRIGNAGLADEFLEGVHMDYDVIRKIRSKQIDFEESARSF